MLHGISFKKTSTQLLQKAIKDKASKDYISKLKSALSYEAVWGFSYATLSFDVIGKVLGDDYAFTPFRYKTTEEGAVYDKEKHPLATGGIRGRYNVFSSITWVCLDIDSTTIADNEMHKILSNTNHHIARTSNPDNKFKYRILLELSAPALLKSDLHWKEFVKALSASIGVKADMLGRSQLFYGYLGRKVYSTIDKGKIDPSAYLKMADIEVARIEEKLAEAYPKRVADKMLQTPYSTFDFAYEAQNGEGTNKLLAAIHKAKELGASKDYVLELVTSINNFWDKPMPADRLRSTVMTAI
jgi:hypothetical protein